MDSKKRFADIVRAFTDADLSLFSTAIEDETKHRLRRKVFTLPYPGVQILLEYKLENAVKAIENYRKFCDRLGYTVSILEAKTTLDYYSNRGNVPGESPTRIHVSTKASNRATARK